MSTLDLETGNEKLADDIDKRIEREVKSQRKPSSRSTASKKSSSSSRPTAAQKTDTEIASRLDRTFDRIVVALQERDDDELANAITEDKEAMSRGIVSLTRSVKPLRNPLIMALNLVEPLLAFGRVGKILLTRWAARRARVMAEREAEAARAPKVPPMEPQQAQPWYEHN